MRAFISGSFYCQAYDKKIRWTFFSGSAIFYYIYKKDNHMTVWLSFHVSL